MVFFALPHLAAGFGLVGTAAGVRMPGRSGPGHEIVGDGVDAAITRDGVVLSGVAPQQMATGVRTDGPTAPAPVTAPGDAQELLDATRNAIRRRPGSALRAHRAVSLSMVSALVGSRVARSGD